MSYPQQPGDQPGHYPQQPGYPQQSGYPQQPGQYPAPPPPMAPFPGGNDVHQQPPSKGTTIAAAVLAVLGAIWALFGTISSLAAVGATGPGSELVMLTQAIAYPIEILTLGIGAALLFMRRDLGRWLVVAGSVVHIIMSIIAVFGMLSAIDPSSELGGAAAGFGVVGLLIVLAPAIATIILALLPPTGRWLSWTPPNRQQAVPPQW